MMPTKEIVVSKKEYDELVTAYAMLKMILNNNGTAYDLDRAVNTARILMGVKIQEEENSNA